MSRKSKDERRLEEAAKKAAQREDDERQLIEVAIDHACYDLPRPAYRRVLETIATYVEACIEAVDEDDTRAPQ